VGAEYDRSPKGCDEAFFSQNHWSRWSHVGIAKKLICCQAISTRTDRTISIVSDLLVAQVQDDLKLLSDLRLEISDLNSKSSPLDTKVLVTSLLDNQKSLA